MYNVNKPVKKGFLRMMNRGKENHFYVSAKKYL